MSSAIRVTRLNSSGREVMTVSQPAGAHALFTAPVVADDDPLGYLTYVAPEPESRRDQFDLAGQIILLATDGSPASASATRVAHAIAAKHGAIVHALSVLDTRPEPIPPPLDLALAAVDEATGPAVHARQVEIVREALTATLGTPPDWPVHVLLGMPALAIVQEANQLHAALIVMGLRRHGPMDRVVHDETTLGVVRRARCPVLGVACGLDGLPLHMVAATDFARSSTLAAQCASMLLPAAGRLTLAYVPPPTGGGSEEGERVIRELGVAAAFARVESELEASSLHVEHVRLQHKLPQSVAKLLLEYAVAVGAPVVAAGSVRHGRLDRWLLGSVSTSLVRDGRRSVLIVPPLDGDTRRSSPR